VHIRTILQCKTLFFVRKQTYFISDWAWDFYLELCIGRLGISAVDDVPFYFIVENLEAWICLRFVR